MNYQPSNSLNFSLETSLTRNPSKAQYITQKDFGATTRYLLGEIDFVTLTTSLRANYSINPNLSVQLYASPFISRGKYTNFSYATNTTDKNFNNRANWLTNSQITSSNNSYLVDENTDAVTDYSFSNPDFAYVQFQSNLVVRWEYVPGSEIFLVWSRGVSGGADVNDSLLTSINKQAFNQPADDTFLIKATYRFIM